MKRFIDNRYYLILHEDISKQTEKAIAISISRK